MATVTIKGSVGETAKVGDKLFNNLDSTKQVQSLLNTVFGSPVIRPPEMNTKCGPQTIGAIKEFQGLFSGKVDGSVWPNGGTIRRLNAMATPLVLKSVKREVIKYGGYEVMYEGEIFKKDKWPKEYKVLLELEHLAKTDTLDVTDRVFLAPQKDLITKDNMVAFLKLIEKLNAYPLATAKMSLQLGVRLIVNYKGHQVTKSKSEPTKKLAAPLRPYAGGMGANMLKKDNLKDYKYSGNKTGRFFHVPAIDGKYYFSYNNLIEVDPNLYGLNCITYVGAVHNVDPYTGAMNSYGTKLATHLKAKEVKMEGKKEKDIKSFFETNDKGTYVMWSEKHMVIVHNAVVHEFWGSDAGKPGGYRPTEIDKWNFHGRTYWVRKTPDDL